MKTKLFILTLAGLQAALTATAGGLPIPNPFSGGTRPAQNPSRTAPATPTTPSTAAVAGAYTDANPPNLTLDQALTQGKQSMDNARDARELKAEVDKQLRSAAGNVHTAAGVQSRICDGLNKYLQSLEKASAMELNQEVGYSELDFRLKKAVDTNAPMSDIRTVITADLQGSKVSADKMIEQLNAYKAKRDAIKQQAAAYHELFLKSGASLNVVDQNYKSALLTGDAATEAVGSKLNALQAKAVAEAATTAGLIAVLTYYSKDLDKEIHKLGGSGNNPLNVFGASAAQRAKLEAQNMAVQKMNQELEQTKKEFTDMKLFAEQARGLLDQIHAQGPGLRARNQQIAQVLGELTDTAKTAMQARSATDKEVEKVLAARDTEAKKQVAGDKIAVFAE